MIRVLVFRGRDKSPFCEFSTKSDVLIGRIREKIESLDSWKNYVEEVDAKPNVYLYLRNSGPYLTRLSDPIGAFAMDNTIELDALTWTEYGLDSSVTIYIRPDDPTRKLKYDDLYTYQVAPGHNIDRLRWILCANRHFCKWKHVPHYRVILYHNDEEIDPSSVCGNFDGEELLAVVDFSIQHREVTENPLYTYPYYDSSSDSENQDADPENNGASASATAKDTGSSAASPPEPTNHPPVLAAVAAATISEDGVAAAASQVVAEETTKKRKKRNKKPAPAAQIPVVHVQSTLPTQVAQPAVSAQTSQFPNIMQLLQPTPAAPGLLRPIPMSGRMAKVLNDLNAFTNAEFELLPEDLMRMLEAAASMAAACMRSRGVSS
jgi:hypothetical protein